MARSGDRELRLGFDEVAELYDRVRPGYPDELFDDLVALAGLTPGARVLEIGCGTGQATRPLAARGLELVCVELGPRLAAVARRNLGAFPRVRIATADFEEWEPDAAAFDAVVAFTSLHWIAAALRFEKPWRLLRPGGRLAVVHTDHVLPARGDPFWADVQEDYDAVCPAEANRPPPPPDEVGHLGSALEASGRFEEVAVRRFRWDVAYTGAEWVAVLDTYSVNRALDDDTRRRLYERIRGRIEERPGGRVTKHYLATLTVAGRLP